MTNEKEEAVTDADGRARLSAANWVEHVCFLAYRGRIAAFVCHRDVSNGKAIKVRLEPASVIRGRVHGPEGEPLTEARVRAIVSGSYETHGIDAQVEEDGGFRLPPIPYRVLSRGQATLEVMRKGCVSARIPLHPGIGPAPLTVRLRRPRLLSGRAEFRGG